MESTETKTFTLTEGQRYQVNPDFILREIAGEYAIIPVGEESIISNAVMTPNDSAVFLWKAFSEPRTIAEAVNLGATEYDAPADVIREDTMRFVRDTLAYKMLLEVE